jgi:hypothetical protein
LLEINLKRNEINRVRKRAEGLSAGAYHPALNVPDAAEAELLIVPEIDPSSGRYEIAEDHYACSNCVNVVASDHEPLDYCEHCGEPRLTEAVMEAGRPRSAKRESAGLARKVG